MGALPAGDREGLAGSQHHHRQRLRSRRCHLDLAQHGAADQGDGGTLGRKQREDPGREYDAALQDGERAEGRALKLVGRGERAFGCGRWVSSFEGRHPKPQVCLLLRSGPAPILLVSTSTALLTLPSASPRRFASDLPEAEGCNGAAASLTIG